MTKYDVFFSHNDSDKDAVKELARRLMDEAGLQPFLDRWHLIPGQPWQEALEEAIDQSGTCAVFIGPRELGPWEHEQMRTALDIRVNMPDFRVIPVLLPGASLPERGRLPRFLARLTWVDFRTGLDDARAFHELVCGIQGIAPEREDAKHAEMVCPFRGLQVFDEEHARFFFGREALTQHLVEQLRSDRFLAVIGPSGSGKSSLVRAGLLHQIREGKLPTSERWPVVLLKPGPHPLSTLAARLLPHLGQAIDPLAARQSLLDTLRQDERGLHQAVQVALASEPDSQRLLLVVDQFEELFTLCRNEPERQSFIANLLYTSSIAGGQTVVLMTMRADFFGKCATYHELAARLAERDVLVGQMSQDELRRAMEKPAQAVGLHYEKGLIDTILDDLGNEPGNLPLLQYTLLELWEQRRGGWLTTDAYHQIGGVQGALAQRVEAIYAKLAPSQQAATKRVMLRLTQPGEGTQDTRRRATLSELLPAESDTSDVEQVVRELADVRLLTTDKDENKREIVDVAHEALIRGWPRLQGWIDDDRAGLRIHRRLTEAAIEWDENQRDEGYLYRNARLVEAKEWQKQHNEEMNVLEQTFLNVSQAAQRRNTQLRWGGIAAIITLIIAIFAISLWNSQQDAQREREAAATATRLVATAETGATHAVAADNARATRAAQAIRAEATAEAEAARAVTAEADAISAKAIAEAEATRAVAADNARATRAAEAISAKQIAEAEAARAVAADNARATRAAEAISAKQTAEAEAARAVAAEEEAQKQQAIAESRALATQAQPVLDQEPQLAILLGAEAMRKTSSIPFMTEEAGRVLYDALAAHPRQVITLHQGHIDEVNHAKLSRDSSRILTASKDGDAKVWDAASGTLLLALRGHSDSITHTTWDHNESRILTASEDHSAKVWDAQNGRLLLTLSGHESPVSHAAWNHDSTRILTVSLDKSVKVWNAESGKLLLTFIGNVNGFTHAAWNHDDNRILTTNLDATAKVWDAESGALLLTLSENSSNVIPAAWSHDSSRILTVSNDRSTKVWDADNGALLLTLSGHDSSVIHAVWSHDDSRILTLTASGRSAKVWDADNGALLLTLSELDSSLHFGYSSGINHAAWSHDSSRILTANNQNARVWDANNGALLLTLSGYDSVFEDLTYDAVNHAVWSQDSSRILIASSSDGVKMWDAQSGVLSLILSASWDQSAKVWDVDSSALPLILSDSVTHAAWSHNDSRILTASDQSAKTWDAQSGEELLTLSGHSDRVTHTAWNHDDSRILTASSDKSAKVWDADNGALLLTLRGHSDKVAHAVWSHDSNRILTASSDKSAKVWDADSGALLLTLSTSYDHAEWSHDDSRILLTTHWGRSAEVWDADSGALLLTLSRDNKLINYAAWSHDDSRILTVSRSANPFGGDGSAEAWDVTSGRLLLTLNGHTSYVHHAAWSHDDSRILTASWDHKAKVWDAQSGKELLSLNGHTSYVHHAAWSHDDSRILTASWDHKAKVWDAQSGALLMTLSEHSDQVNYAAWSYDDKHIVTVSGNGRASIYFIDIEDLLEFACQRSLRNMKRSEWERYMGSDVPYQRTCPNLPIPPDSN